MKISNSALKKAHCSAATPGAVRATARCSARRRPVQCALTRALLLFVIASVSLLTGCRNYEKMAEQSYALGEYYDAARLYKTAYSRTPAKDKATRARLSFQVGESNRFINAVAKAAAGYTQAIRYEYPDSTVYLRLAQMQTAQGEYKNAVNSYTIYIDNYPANALTPLAESGLSTALQAAEMKLQLPRYAVKRFELFNSRRAEYSPSYNRDDSTVIYLTSSRDKAKGENLSGITGMKPADIFAARRNERGVWQAPEVIDSDINSEYDDGACSFSPDGSVMYFTRCRESNSAPVYAEIYSSQRSGAAWGAPKKCEIMRDSLSSFAHPAVSADGKYLYFVSDMPGGVGGKDIWRCAIEAQGTFGAVENVGVGINTAGDDMFPFIHEDGSLYFSSDGWAGMGGLDLFRAKYDEGRDAFLPIENLGYPINSAGDDFGITFQPSHNRGFFASNRGDLRGWDHIFSFVGDEFYYKVSGYVYDMDGEPLPEAVINLIGDNGTNIKLSTNGDGAYSQTVERGVSYVLLATCRGYLNTTAELVTDTIDESFNYELNFPLAAISRPAIIDNIFYEFDSANLTAESSTSLDALIKTLNDNPNITIELGAHCDYFGDSIYNARLSQRRAESVVSYLTAGGIAADRLTAKGYGESQPKVITKKLAAALPFLKQGDTLTEAFILQLSQEEQDICNSINRRTEFRVLRTTYGLYRQ